MGIEKIKTISLYFIVSFKHKIRNSQIVSAIYNFSFV